MASALIVVLTGAGVFFVAVLFCVPRILFRPGFRSLLWRLRDEVVDSQRVGQLPEDHAAPVQLVNRIEGLIFAANDLTFLSILSAWPAFARAPKEVKERVSADLKPDISAMSADAQTKFREFNDRLSLLTVGVPMLGSWSGIVTIVVGFPILLLIGFASLVSSPIRREIREVVREQQVISNEIAMDRALACSDHSLAAI